MKIPWLLQLKFLFTSTNAHGVHSPFVFHLIKECFYKKEKVSAELEKLLPQFHQYQNKKQLQLLAETLKFLKLNKIAVFASKTHGIVELSKLLEISNSTVFTIATKAIFISAFQNKLVLEPKEIIKQKTCIILESPHFNIKVWLRLQEIFKDAIIIDTFYWGFIFIGKPQKPQKFKIRTEHFLKWDYKPIKL